jgi:hypothetical protein
MLVSSRGWFEPQVKNHVQRKALELAAKLFDIGGYGDRFDVI